MTCNFITGDSLKLKLDNFASISDTVSASARETGTVACSTVCLSFEGVVIVVVVIVVHGSGAYPNLFCFYFSNSGLCLGIVGRNLSSSSNYFLSFVL